MGKKDRHKEKLRRRQEQNDQNEQNLPKSFDKKNKEKTIEHRTVEINELKRKLENMKILDELARITNILEIMDDYLLTGEPSNGKISLNKYSIPRVLEYSFSKTSFPSIYLRHIG